MKVRLIQYIGFCRFIEKFVNLPDDYTDSKIEKIWEDWRDPKNDGYWEKLK